MLSSDLGSIFQNAKLNVGGGISSLPLFLSALKKCRGKRSQFAANC